MSAQRKKRPRLLLHMPSANAAPEEWRKWHENRGYATARNLANRAARKAREYYKTAYPGVGMAKWPTPIKPASRV